jgi:hypothetical protein
MRTFQLPQGVDEEQVKADFENGVLTVHIPKAALPQPKRIQIAASGRQPQQAAVGSGNVSNQQSTSTGKTSGQKSTTTSQQDRDKEKMAAQGR